MSISEIAKDLGLSDRTIQRYCKEGFLSAIMKGIDISYFYEGYSEFKTEEL